MPTGSLWETTAPPPPPTESLRGARRADVAVIGAGYTGLSAALHLAEHGSVAILEAAEVGQGGAGRNVGLVNAGLWLEPRLIERALPIPFGERLLAELAAAPELVFSLIDQYAIECEGRRTGTLHCALGAQGLKEIERRASQWQARGAPVRVLDAHETESALGSPAYRGALLDPRAGTLQPLAYARGLARAAIERGARLFTRSAVLEARHDGAGWRLRTPAGELTAERVVVAGDAYAHGPWAQPRAEQVRLPYFNCATAPLPPGMRRVILPGGQGAWDTRRVLSSFRLDAAGRLVWGSFGALRGIGARVHLAWARRAALATFPQLSCVSFEYAWDGHIGMTPDHLPRLHQLAPGVISASGYNGRGIGPGTAFGRLLALHVAGRLRLDELPLPVTAPRPVRLRRCMEALYTLGAQLAHLL